MNKNPKTRQKVGFRVFIQFAIFLPHLQNYFEGETLIKGTELPIIYCGILPSHL